MKKRLIITGLVSMILFLTCCKKDLPNKYSVYEGQTTQNVLSNDANTVYQENAFLIDSVHYNLESSQEQIDIGTFIFSAHDSIGMDVEIGDVFMYTGNGGYLRKVTGVKLGKRGFTLETVQASLAEFFLKRTIQEVSDPIKYDFSVNSTLYSEGPESIKVSGNVSLSSGFNWDLVFDNGLKYLKYETNAASLTSSLKLDYALEVGETYVDFEKTIATRSKFTPVAGIPFITTIKLVARVKSTVEAELKSSASGSMNTAVQLGAVYDGSSWTYIKQFNPNFSYTIEPPKDKIKGSLDVSVVPVIEVKVLSLLGTEAELVQSNKVVGQVSITDKAWKFDAVGSLDASIGLDLTIFDDDVDNPSTEFNVGQWSYYSTPTTMALFSGDGQDYVAGQALKEPIVVRVGDSYGNPQSNVHVTFEVGPEDGSILTDSKVWTNEEGKAQAKWKPKNENSTLQVVVKDVNGIHLKGSPIEINAHNGYFTDPRDGEVYRTTKIGDQIWFAQNLRYKNSDIVEFTDVYLWRKWYDLFWGGTSTRPGFCNIDFDKANDQTYGKLYNFYAVEQVDLCPNGWHIPTQADLEKLRTYLGDNPGGKLKSKTIWQAPNTGATNETGFSGLPGYRNFSGDQIMALGYFWSSTRRLKNGNNNNAYVGKLEYDNNLFQITFQGINNACYCRCLKDQ
ncbi:MAG: hypothetical protein JJ975_04080 [Bacteroidia bacterium]|nr:hypothetical protein [Bacteroidia bacterium]